MAKKILPPLERFMSKVSPEPNTGCWLWLAGVDKDGYGKFWLNGATIRAPSAAWMLMRSSEIGGLWVLHRCDNPPCVNPDHLYLGTIVENTRDRSLRTRTTRSTFGLPYGVKRSNGGERFEAHVRFARRLWYLGIHQTAEEASAIAVAFREKCYQEGAPK